MINEKSIQAVKQARYFEEFCKPLYESYCFSRIPATVRFLLTGQGKVEALPADVLGTLENSLDVVILLFIDGFGWRFLQHYLEKYPFLSRCIEKGVLSKLTAQFPSTTAAQVTCIHTGREVGESGIYEWFYYEPSIDRVIAPLLSSFAGDKTIGTLVDAGIDVNALYPRTTIYQTLATEGISSYVLQPSNIAHSPYSEAMCKGATYLPYKQLTQALETVKELALGAGPKEKRYIFLYFGELDSAGHHHGLFSTEYEQVAEKMFRELEEHLYNTLQSRQGKIGVIATADHGMIEIDPKNTFYINQKVPEILPWIKKNRKGELIAPAGSCRDFFFHIQEDQLGRAEELLRRILGKRALVFRTTTLIEQGFFGSHGASREFLARVGNLVLLARGHESIWWYEKHRFEQKFFAVHGGLTPEEMETIFLFSLL